MIGHERRSTRAFKETGFEKLASMTHQIGGGSNASY